MIIEFSLGNYRSFNEIQTLSFRATGLVSEDKTVDTNNIAEVSGQRLLKTVGVYGPNGSGKSNLLKGLQFFIDMVKSSLTHEYLLRDNHLYSHNKSALVSETDNLGYCQVRVILNGKKYRYGYTLGLGKIESEWLFGPAQNNETFYFIREGNKVNINRDYFAEGTRTPYELNLRENTLFLTFCSSYNGEISSRIRDFIANRIHTDYNTASNKETNKLVSDGKKAIVLSWLAGAGMTFRDVIIKNYNSIGNLVSEADNMIYRNSFAHNDEAVAVLLIKAAQDTTGKVATITMNLENDESQGTQKYYAYIGQLYEKFENGGLFISDEIDSNFHPALLRKIIGMFNNPKINKANAQLLFTSHDTNLMSPEIMRRDQFYFTEKSPTDATVLYSLADLKGIRNNADFAKQYLSGYYGALPVLGNYIEEQSNPE